MGSTSGIWVVGAASLSLVEVCLEMRGSWLTCTALNVGRGESGWVKDMLISASSSHRACRESWMELTVVRNLLWQQGEGMYDIHLGMTVCPKAKHHK